MFSKWINGTILFRGLGQYGILIGISSVFSVISHSTVYSKELAVSIYILSSTSVYTSYDCKELAVGIYCIYVSS